MTSNKQVDSSAVQNGIKRKEQPITSFFNKKPSKRLDIQHLEKENKCQEPPPTDDEAHKSIIERAESKKASQITRNCAHLVLLREYLNKKLPRTQSKWSVPPWISFGSTGTISAMDFDKDGVLLAIGDNDGVIRIFDWDMVEAADIRARRQLARGETWLESQPIKSVRSFRIPNTSIGIIKWNPFNQDVLVVGDLYSGAYRFFDLGFEGALPVRSLRTRSKSMKGGSMSLTFMDKETVVCSAGKLLLGFSIDKEQVLWSLSFKGTVKDISLIRSGLVLVGTSTGVLSVLDTTRMQKSTLSQDRRPTVVANLSPHRVIGCPSMVDEGYCPMGVSRISVSAGDKGACTIRWVTLGGWYLATVLNLTTMSATHPEIIHATDEVEFVNKEGANVSVPRKEWSIGYHVKASFCNGAAFFERVSPKQYILAGHDCRVGGSEGHYAECQSERPVVMSCGPGSQPASRIALSRRKGPLDQLIVHPNGQWLVVATKRKELYVIHARSKAD